MLGNRQTSQSDKVEVSEVRFRQIYDRGQLPVRLPDRSQLMSVQLQEDLHSAQLRMADQEDEIARLGWELELRPRDVDARVAALQDEVAGLKLIAGV